MINIQIKDTAVPALGFGTYTLTGRTCIQSVADAIAIGYRHIDTAEMYENEEEVGKGIKSSGINREDLFITTKVWYSHLRRDELFLAVEDSLRKLQTDYLNLLLIHWPSPDISMEEPLEAMVELQQQEKIRLLGVSNFTCSMIEKATQIAPIACNQVEYHPFLDQSRLLEAVHQHEMMLTSYCPIAKGKVMDDHTIQEIADKYGKTPAQVTLRWHMQQPKVAAIPKSSNPERRRQNFDIFDFELMEEEMNLISALRGNERMVDPTWAPDWDC